MSIVFDYADIRSRMLGEDKPTRKPGLWPDNWRDAVRAVNVGCDLIPASADLAQPGSDRTIYQRFTKDQWRAISAEQWRHLVDGDWP